ncbi:MAG TPA: dienelactone hydrolase family protein [Thermohalobaculum sp.]|nr:dienelactone hydrolase family protein [Thermohalobaculum sp.]
MPPIAVSEADRRAFLAGLASLPLATVLAWPELARAQAGRLEPVEIAVAGGAPATGVIGLPEARPAPAVLLIHEWWGLNDQIKAVAAELAAQGYIALAIDLHGGEVASTPEQARALTGSVDPAQATAQLVAAIGHLRGHAASNGRVGTLGWCFGGAWSLNASIAAPVDATVIYYGRVNRDAEDLAALAGPVLGHFGTEDRSIDAAMVDGFERAMQEAGKRDLLTVHWYEADHAFANPTGARYDAEDAALAWERTLAFFAEHLRG